MGRRCSIDAKALTSTVCMREEVVVIKWGGGLITQKEKFCVPRPKVINSLAKVLRVVLDHAPKPTRIVLVHGAGSYGHLRSKMWRLQEGKLPDGSVAPEEEDGCHSQEEAVYLVREELLELNRLVCTSLFHYGIKTCVHSPHKWAHGTGPSFKGDISGRFLKSDTAIDVTYGDVVDVGSSSFGILSGDDLVVRLSCELPNVRCLVFAVGGGIDGLLSLAPSKGGSNEHLIHEWSDSMPSNSFLHQENIDVTGGMAKKAACGAMVARETSRVRVMVVNGEIPSRVLACMMGEDKVRGTRIVARAAVNLSKL